MRPILETWPPDRIAKYVKLWNDGLEVAALNERFGTRSDRVVAALRAAGYVLTRRTRNSEAFSFGPRLHRPEDAAASWAPNHMTHEKAVRMGKKRQMGRGRA